MGVGVRHAGDDGAAAYRIPGLVTSNKGTLLGVYDVAIIIVRIYRSMWK